MLVINGSAATRCRQVALVARPASTVIAWQPMAKMMSLGLVIVAMGSPSGVPVRLAVSGTAVAAASAYLLDDSAAVTLAASPTTLATRRLLRVGVAALAAGVWWVAAIAIAAHRAPGLSHAGRALQGATLLTVALAGGAIATERAGRAAGGIAGATFTGVLFATTFLPSRWWLPLPQQPDAPGATPRLLVVSAVALLVLGFASRDPAHRLRASPLLRRA